jgi:MurNAc alpha-1-phosphate uridylyltransferase
MVDSLAGATEPSGEPPGQVAGLVLAAGAGTRLRPLTLLRPKPLCPVGDRALLDWALESLQPVAPALAVNVHHGREQIEAHLAARRVAGSGAVHLSVERDEALGTAGAVGHLREWLDGRHVVVANGDTWHRADLRRLLEGWDGERVRVLTPTPLPFGPRSAVIASLLPWSRAARLAAAPSGLWEVLWAEELAAGRLEAVHDPAVAIDCGTPAQYLRANLEWSGGESVVGEGAVVQGSIERTVVWPGSRVEAGERLVDAIRAEDRTVLVRP